MSITKQNDKQKKKKVCEFPSGNRTVTMLKPIKPYKIICC